MLEINLKRIYQIFMRKYVDKKYLQKHPKVKVLGENFLDGYYIVIFEVDTHVVDLAWANVSKDLY